jgi:hypothetical protein
LKRWEPRTTIGLSKLWNAKFRLMPEELRSTRRTEIRHFQFQRLAWNGRVIATTWIPDTQPCSKVPTKEREECDTSNISRRIMAQRRMLCRLTIWVRLGLIVVIFLPVILVLGEKKRGYICVMTSPTSPFRTVLGCSQ